MVGKSRFLWLFPFQMAEIYGFQTGVILTTYKLKMILQVSLDTVIFRLYRGFFTFTHLTGRSLFPRMILASY